MLSVPHLDREFDYLVSAEQSDDAQPGVRVRVRFHGRLVDAFILERRSETDHVGKLGWLDRVVSAERVLTPDVRRLVDAVAARYAGTRADVLRLAIPPRHANVEKETPAEPAPDDRRSRSTPRGGPNTAGANSFSPHFAKAAPPGRSGRRCPASSWADRLAEAAAATVDAGRGVLAIVPDQRDVDALHDASVRLVDEGRVVALSAGLGPAQRYRRWLSVLRGSARLVIGTRSAVFAPVADLGLVLVWDDGDDTLAEPRAPYPHAREVGMLRAHQLRCAAMIGGYSRTAEAQAMVRSRWAHDLVAARPVVRSRAPRVIALEDSGFAQERDPAAHSARLPSMALQAARSALDAGRPVLVQVPRRGYVPALACGRCRAIARCRHCTGPLSLPDRDASGAVCRWCGREEPALRCARCGSDAVRAVVVGARRTAEELGRAFPGTTVVTSGGDTVVSDGAWRSGPRRRHSRGRAGGGGWLRRRAAARCLGAAGPSGSACGRGHAAPLDGGVHAGPPPRRRWRGGRGRRVGGADRAGADPLGPGRARRGRARCPRRGGPAARCAHGRRGRRSGGRGRTPGDRASCPTPRSFSGPSTCRPGPADPPAPRPPARSAECWSGCPAPTGWSWPRRCGGPPGCSAPATISSRFGCKSTRCT